jgi:hypothetical protein
MRFLLLISALVAVVIAQANFEAWSPSSNEDARSPCPALNALANHGILPREGRNYTVPVVVKALGEGLNVSSEIATTLSHLAVLVSADPASGAFDLDDLNKHNAIEHDASLSRQDFDLGGDAHTFDSDVFAETLKFFGGASDVGIKEVAAARWGRIQASKSRNTKFTYGENQTFPSYFESSNYFSLFKKPKTNLASVEWIKIFFRKVS